MTYGICAYQFRWTPEEVNKIPYDKLQCILHVYECIKKKEADEIKKSNKRNS